jgi:hypothetical protein
METLNPHSAIPQLALFQGDSISETSARDHETKFVSPVSPELLSLFEAMTGWVVEFQETRTSQRLRQRVKRHNLIQARHQLTAMLPVPQGEFTISDMSALWPANRPTAHRAKCDRFVFLFSELVTRLQSLEVELKRFQFASTDHQLPEEVEHHPTDSFPPRYPYQTDSERNGSFELVAEQSSELNSLRSSRVSAKPDCIFVDSAGGEEAWEPLGSTTQSFTEQEPSNQWQIGGQRGFSDNRYVDWKLRKDQRIELVMGQIDSPESPGDASINHVWESKLTLNPATSRFWISNDGSPAPDVGFCCYDHSTGKFSRISLTDKVQQLHRAQSIIVTTEPMRINNDEFRQFIAGFHPAAHRNSDELATAIQGFMQVDSSVLVLTRN